MNPLGYLLTLAGIVLVRQTVVGRAHELPGDVRDLSLSLVNGDMAATTEVISRRGITSEAGSGEVATLPASDSLTAEVERLGNAAKGYRLGATGPDYYDCSGLVWRAMRNLGIYNGARFTTHNFAAVADREKWQQIQTPSSGDIVLWSRKHMGVSTGGNGMYSARSTEKGIGPSTVSGDSTYFGRQATYWRVK